MFQEIRSVLDGTYKRRARMNTAVGIAAGLLVGAAAGILLAPKSGKETRADIKEGAKTGAKKVQEAAQHLSGATREKMAALKTHAQKEKKDIRESEEGEDKPDQPIAE
ncbi:MAG: YtxH domain-containing protein [Clostridiaceae bacterium]|nr:YtxH domain-containing protein [Clostridiaceae bacterium]